MEVLKTGLTISAWVFAGLASFYFVRQIQAYRSGLRYEPITARDRFLDIPLPGRISLVLLTINGLVSFALQQMTTDFSDRMLPRPEYMDGAVQKLPSAWNLFWQSISIGSLAVDVALGLVVTWALVRWFGKKRGEEIDERLTVGIMVITAIGIFMKNIAFVPALSEVPQHTAFVTSQVILAFFPSLLSAALASLIFSPKKSPGMVGLIGGLIFFFIYWFLFILMSGQL